MFRKISLLLVCILFFSGWGRRETKEKVNIKVAFWGSVEEIKILQETVKEWQKTHPRIRVILQHTPTGSYLQKILTRIAGGDPPDIIFSEANDFVFLKTKGVFLDLMPFIRKDTEFDLKKYFPQILRRFQEGKKLYILPRDIAPFACVYYNKNIFKKEGVTLPNDEWNWEGLLKRAIKLTKKKGGRTIQYGFYTVFWENFVYSAGGSLVDNVENPRSLTLNKKESLEGLKFYIDLINKYKVMPSPQSMMSMQMSAVQMFMSGRLAMYGSGIWETPLFRKIRSFNWDVAMFPKGLTGKRAFGSGGSGYGILKTTPHPQEAWEVLKCLAGKRGEELLAQSGLAQPADRTIAQGPLFAENTLPPLNKKMLNEATKYIVFEPAHPRWRESREKYLNPTLELAFNGTLPLKKAIKEVTPLINQLLREDTKK